MWAQYFCPEEQVCTMADLFDDVVYVYEYLRRASLIHKHSGFS